MSFTLPGLTKTSKPGDLPKTSFLVAFWTDIDLCPVECLRVYLDRTKGFRSNNKDQQDKLFLSLVIPHKPISSATLDQILSTISGHRYFNFFCPLSSRSFHNDSA